MDFLWLGLAFVLFVLSLGLIALCERPRDSSWACSTPSPSWSASRCWPICCSRCSARSAS